MDAVSVKNAELKRTFLTAFASDPVKTMESYVASQAKDLDLIVGQDRASHAAIGGGPAWREEIRRSDLWEGDWVKEGVSVFGSRQMEKAIREATSRQSGQPAPSGQFGQGYQGR